MFKSLNILYFLRKVDFNHFFSLFFFAKDLSLNNVYWILIFFRDVKSIPLEGTVSQNLFLGLSFYFI